MEKMPTLVFSAPHCGPFWTYWGVCQSAHNEPIWNFLSNFLYKIWIQRGPSYKKLPTHVFEAPFCGPFSKMGGLPIGPAQNWPIWNIFNLFSHKIRIKRGSVLRKNLVTHVFGALQCGPFWTNGGVGQSAQTGPILTFENIFLYRIKIQRGCLLWKKLPSHLVRAPCGGPFWSNAWLPTGQKWADQIFLDHFEF